MSSNYRLTVTLARDGAELIREEADCETLHGIFREFGDGRGGYTSQRFVDTIEALFLRAAQAPKIEFAGDRFAG